MENPLADLFHAIEIRDIGMANIVIKNGNDLNKKNAKSLTPLMITCIKGYTEMVGFCREFLRYQLKLWFSHIQ